MLKVEVKVDDTASKSLRRLLSALDGEGMELLNEAGGRAANTAAIEYHEDYNDAKLWRGKRYMSGPAKKPGDFGQNVALGWNFRTANKAGATISNGAPYYRFKVTGGTITPKRAKALTIPLVPGAAGRRAKDYESATGNRLFKVKGKKALFEKNGEGVRPVYALVARVTQAPWPNALPETEDLALAFEDAWLGGLEDLLEEV